MFKVHGASVTVCISRRDQWPEKHGSARISRLFLLPAVVALAPLAIPNPMLIRLRETRAAS